jgi:ElaB/YqjD/DUF883 family membrane-anchored ribosome-binding protein
MGQAGEKAAELGTRASEQADAAMTSAGQQLRGAAQALRDRAPAGRAGELTTGAADALERGGAYLQRSDPNAVMRDAEALIRRYPMQALAVGLGVGFLIALTLRRR